MVVFSLWNSLAQEIYRHSGVANPAVILVGQ